MSLSHGKCNLCQSLFFNKVTGLRPVILLKRDSGTGIFLRILWIFKNTYFEKHLRMGASELCQLMQSQVQYPQNYIWFQISELNL